MKITIALTLGVLLLAGCTEKTDETPATDVATTSTAAGTSQTVATQTVEQTAGEPVTTASSAETTTSENEEQGTWAGQIAFAQPVSMFNYVGAESGDFAPIRFRNDSEAGKKILAACSNGDMCELTGTIEWLDEAPPPDASAIGRIVRVDSVKRMPAATP